MSILKSEIFSRQYKIDVYGRRYYKTKFKLGGRFLNGRSQGITLDFSLGPLCVKGWACLRSPSQTSWISSIVGKSVNLCERGRMGKTGPLFHFPTLSSLPSSFSFAPRLRMFPPILLLVPFLPEDPKLPLSFPFSIPDGDTRVECSVGNFR
uniref:Uncharacterized protein n=1 Tax=Cacopsylla melanoneura TaxID=428564 RepID=A0A8D8QQG9_9HEMI